MSHKQRKPSVILMLISFVIGTVALLASIGGFVSAASEIGYRSTSGTVTSVDWKEGSGKARTNMRCSPVVEYEVNGQSYTHGPDQYSVFGKGSDCEFHSGDSLNVRYDPANPAEATVSSSTFDWATGIVGGIAAILFLLFAPLRMLLGASRPASDFSASAYTQ